MQKEVSKIQKEIIENFEDHYKKNVIQPTIELNYYGDVISHIYSEKYGMVYMDECRQIRYDYRDEERKEIIQTFFGCLENTFNRTLVTKVK